MQLDIIIGQYLVFWDYGELKIMVITNKYKFITIFLFVIYGLKLT